MNFKTPFKVLTTAALIGTLSLSAVAPGAASAAEKTAKTVQTKAELAASHVVLEDAKGNLITLDYNTYLEAKSVGIDLGAEPISIKVGDKFYNLNDFLEAKSVSNNNLEEAVKLLDKNDLSQDINPAEGTIEDGKLVVVPGDEDFTVTEIAAINGTQVEVTFNKAPKDAPKAADFQIDGLEVKSVNAKSGSDKTFVLTTTAQEAGKEYTVKYGEQTKKFTAVQQVSKLEAVTTSYAQQVGKEVTVEYKVLDQAGKPVVGKEVYVRAGSDSASVGFPPVEKTVKSDENGVVKFTYTRNEETVNNSGVQYAEAVTAYVVDQPLVRNSAASVSWTIADTSRISVEATKAGKLGHGTAVEYTVEAKDADNKALAKGEDIKLVFDYANTVSQTNASVNVEQKQANGTWKEVNSTISGADITLLEAGKTTVRVTFTPNDADKVIDVVPSFFYSESGVVDEKATIAIAPALSFEKQKATLTLEPVSEETEVAYDKEKSYVLTAKDQFGAPYLGTVRVDSLENADGLSSTKAVANYSILADVDEDESFEETSNTDTYLNIDLSEDDNGKAIVNFKNTISSNKLTPVAFVNPTTAGYIDAKEANVKAPTITFGQEGPSSIKLASKTTTAAIGGTIDFSATLLDKAGKEVEPTTQLILKVQKYNTSTKKWEDNSASTISILDENGDEVNGGTGAVTLYVIAAGDVASKYDKITVTPAAGDYRLVAFSDNDESGTLETDEVSANAEFTVDAALFSKAELTSNATYNYAEGSALNNAIALATAKTAVQYTYNLQDQSGKAFEAPTGGQKVTWTVTNTTDEDIVVKEDSDSLATIKKGETKSVSTTAASAATSTAIKVIADADATEGTVTVKATTNVKNTATEQTTYIYAVDKLVSDATTSKVTYTGTVTSFNLDTDANDSIKADGNFLVVTAGTVGDIVVDNSTAVSYIVEGNTANEAAFEKAVKIGSTVLVSTDGVGNTTITLK